MKEVLALGVHLATLCVCVCVCGRGKEMRRDILMYSSIKCNLMVGYSTINSQQCVGYVNHRTPDLRDS